MLVLNWKLSMGLLCGSGGTSKAGRNRKIENERVAASPGVFAGKEFVSSR